MITPGCVTSASGRKHCTTWAIRKPKNSTKPLTK